MAIIAIGIGANTAVFSVVDAALLRPLPFAEPSRLFMLAGVNPKRGIDGASFSYPAFVELAARDRTRSSGRHCGGHQRSVQLDRWPAAGATARCARVRELLRSRRCPTPPSGALFIASEEAPGGPAVAVLGRRYWMQPLSARAGARSARRLTLNGAPYTVVGALGIDMPPPFDDVDVWTTRVDEIGAFTRAQIDGGLGYLPRWRAFGRARASSRRRGKWTPSRTRTARANPPTPTPIRTRVCGSSRCASAPSATPGRRCWC